MNSAAMVDGEASIVVVGQTTGSFDGPANGDWDIVVLKLDAASGTEIWRYQVCTAESRLKHSSSWVFRVRCLI